MMAKPIFSAPHLMRGLLAPRGPASSAGRHKRPVNQVLTVFVNDLLHIHPRLTLRQCNLYRDDQRPSQARRSASAQHRVRTYYEIQHTSFGVFRDSCNTRTGIRTRAQTQALETRLEKRAHQKFQSELVGLGNGDSPLGWSRIKCGTAYP